MKKNGFIQKHPIAKHLLLMLAISVAILVLVFVFVKIYSRHGDEYVMENYTDRIEAMVYEALSQDVITSDKAASYLGIAVSEV